MTTNDGPRPAQNPWYDASEAMVRRHITDSVARTMMMRQGAFGAESAKAFLMQCQDVLLPEEIEGLMQRFGLGRE